MRTLSRFAGEVASQRVRPEVAGPMTGFTKRVRGSDGRFRDSREAALTPTLSPQRGERGQMGKNRKMTGPEVMDVARDAIVTLILVAAPLMLVGLVVGVVVSLFQALTQIQEQTLVFVPKILAIFLAMLIALPFMADALHSNFLRIAAHITNG